MRNDPDDTDDHYTVPKAQSDALTACFDRLNAAVGGDFSAFYQEFERLRRSGRHADAVALWESIDREQFRAALHDERGIAEDILEHARWHVAGVEVPPDVERSIWSAPGRMRRVVMESIRTAIRGLASAHPRLGQILENAAARREEGQVFAEASRERRDELYRERVEWVASKYREVRRKYQDGPSGDSAARMEVAVLYSRVTGKKPMHDKSVRNLLEAATRIDAATHAEKAE